jgi:hypothetical protein
MNAAQPVLHSRQCAQDVEAAAARTTVYFAEDALRHGFIEGIATPTMPIQDVFYLTDQYLAGLPD